MNFIKPTSKTAILFSLFVMLSSNSVKAVQFGIKAGLSAADQSCDYAITYFDLNRLHRTGLAAGVYAEFPLGEIFGIRTEIDYVEKGSGLKVNIYGFSSPTPIGIEKFEDRADYLGFNLLATIAPFRLGWVNPYIIAGPRLDVLVSSSSDIPSPIMDDLKSTAFGATAGLGTKIPVNNSISVLVEGIYSPDFTDTFKGEFLTVKNSTFQFMTGISF